LPENQQAPIGLGALASLFSLTISSKSIISLLTVSQFHFKRFFQTLRLLVQSSFIPYVGGFVCFARTSAAFSLREYVQDLGNAAITLRDGVVIYTDVSRPAKGPKRLPAIISWSPGKGLPKNAPRGMDPLLLCAQGIRRP
jgi:predicted acyl esterase